jgi:hypothetical protein
MDWKTKHSWIERKVTEVITIQRYTSCYTAWYSAYCTDG